jgi:hypothetical protein
MGATIRSRFRQGVLERYRIDLAEGADLVVTAIEVPPDPDRKFFLSLGR